MQEAQISQIDLTAKKIKQKRDFVAEEAPLHIFVNQVHYVTILCFPSQLKELAIGHLLSEGVLKSMDEIREIRLEKDGKCSCPYDECGAEFNFHCVLGEGRKVRCPTCLRNIVFTKGWLLEKR